MPTDPPELSEDVDLDLEQRRTILDTYARLDRMTHYEVLGVPPTADKKTIKRAYFKLAAQNHPDRYFTRKLGTYKAKLEAIFARTTDAFELLNTPAKKAQYDAQIGNAPAAGAAQPAKAAAPPAPAAPPPAKAAPPVDREAAAKRQAALDALRQRFTENQARAKRYVEAALRARAAGDVAGAVEAYEIALTFAPNDATLQAALAECQKAAGGRLAEASERQAMLEERFGQWAEAARSWQRVAEARPDDEKVRARLAAALAKAGGGKA
jgi:curved DNA-binding protein CbpA